MPAQKRTCPARASHAPRDPQDDLDADQGRRRHQQPRPQRVAVRRPPAGRRGHVRGRRDDRSAPGRREAPQRGPRDALAVLVPRAQRMKTETERASSANKTWGLVFARLCLALPFLAAATPAPSGPTLPFEDHGACPFECCVYRVWTVRRDTAVRRERRDDSETAFRLLRGERVHALSGVVMTTAAGVATVRKKAVIGTNETPQEVRPGDRIYLLNAQGEGFWKYWLRGRIDSDQFPGDSSTGCLDGGGPPGDCPVVVTKRPTTVWWVKVRNREGEVGWTREVESFGEKDACG